jgi:hypothetical protein
VGSLSALSGSLSLSAINYCSSFKLGRGAGSYGLLGGGKVRAGFFVDVHFGGGGDCICGDFVFEGVDHD